MRFEKPTPFEFDFNGDSILWTIQRLVSRDWLVTCEHRVFLETFNWHMIGADSLRTIIECGKEKNQFFFYAMLDSFMNNREN